MKPQQWPAHWARPVQSTCPSPSHDCPRIAPTLCPCPVLSRNSLCFLGWGGALWGPKTLGSCPESHPALSPAWGAGPRTQLYVSLAATQGPPYFGLTTSPQPSVLHPCLPGQACRCWPVRTRGQSLQTSRPLPRKAEPKAAAGLKLPSGGGPGGHVTPAGQEGPVLGLPVHFI